MYKLAFLSIFLVILLAPCASIMAQETPSATQEPVYIPPALPTSPLDFLLGGSGNTKDKTQGLMEQSQQAIEEAAGRATGQATDALKNEFSRQVDAQTENIKKTTSGFMGRIMETVSGKIEEFKNYLKNIFNNFKRSLFDRPDTY